MVKSDFTEIPKLMDSALGRWGRLSTYIVGVFCLSSTFHSRYQIIDRVPYDPVTGHSDAWEAGRLISIGGWYGTTGMATTRIRGM